MPAADECPGNRRGFFIVRGGASLDVSARYFSDTGSPLLTAAECAAMLDIRTRTIYEWRRRGFLTVRGLDERNRELYDAAEVACVHATPGQRTKAA